MKEKTEVENCYSILRKGGLILYPTDTIWGIGCDATNDKAVEQVFKLKGRENNKPLIVLVKSVSMLDLYLNKMPTITSELITYSEKPLTIVYSNPINVSDKLIAEDGSLGIRVTSDPFCQRLIAKLDRPIVSTSANLSGHPPPNSYHDIHPDVLSGVDYIVNLKQDLVMNNPPSSVVKLSENGEIKILRK